LAVCSHIHFSSGQLNAWCELTTMGTTEGAFGL
jgi:hypothetical protein